MVITCGPLLVGWLFWRAAAWLQRPTFGHCRNQRCDDHLHSRLDYRTGYCPSCRRMGRLGGAAVFVVMFLWNLPWVKIAKATLGWLLG